MPAPLAAALLFGGIMGGREALKSKRKSKEQDQIREALARLSGAGELGHRGYGPPTPIGMGTTELDDQQIAVTQALAQANPEAALTMALNFGKDNIAATALARAQSEHDEDQGIKRDQLELLNDRLQFDKDVHVFGKSSTAAELELAQLAVTDQDVGQQQAALNKQSNYRFIDSEGKVEVIPLRGTEAFNAQRGAINADGRLLNLVTRMRELNAVHGGTEIDPASAAFAELEALEKDIQLAMKDVLGLGAITGPDVSFIEGLAPDVNSPLTMLLSSPEALETSYRELSKRLENNLELQLERVRNWENLDNEIRQAAIEELHIAKTFRPGQRAPGAGTANPTGDMLRGAAAQGSNLPLPPQVQVPLAMLESIGVSPRALIQQGMKASGTMAGILKGIF